MAKLENGGMIDLQKLQELVKKNFTKMTDNDWKLLESAFTPSIPSQKLREAYIFHLMLFVDYRDVDKGKQLMEIGILKQMVTFQNIDNRN